jgi:hypothetical protein
MASTSQRGAPASASAQPSSRPFKRVRAAVRPSRLHRLTLSQGHQRRGAVDLHGSVFAAAQDAFLQAAAVPREAEDPAQAAARFGGQLAAPYSAEMRRLSAQWRSLARQPAVVHVAGAADAWAGLAHCSR